MDFLTSSILGGIIWDSLKKFGQATVDNLREPLKKWLLTDTDINNIANTVNEAPPEFKKTEKFITAFVDDNEEIKKILSRPILSNENNIIIKQEITENNGTTIGNINGNIVIEAGNPRKKS